MERVSIISGKLPIIVVAPHGFNGNDENTAYIAEYIAQKINAYAVINRGWERDDDVDFLNDKADCNNVLHCHEDVVKDEFLDPILRFKNRIMLEAKFDTVYVYYIHGMSNKHRKICGDNKLDIVLGHGAGSPNSFTCKNWEKDAFAHQLMRNGLTTYIGASGGPMSGWARNNMNQLFRKWYYDSMVSSMQIEIIYERRALLTTCQSLADILSDAMRTICTLENFSTQKKWNVY